MIESVREEQGWGTQTFAFSLPRGLLKVSGSNYCLKKNFSRGGKVGEDPRPCFWVPRYQDILGAIQSLHHLKQHFPPKPSIPFYL